MTAEVDGLEAASCTVESGLHHRVATAILDSGLHTLCEKPLALTIRACNQVIEAARRNGRILSVAENFAISRSFDTRPLRRIHWKAIAERATTELRTLGHDIDPRTLVGRLSVAEQTIVAIARALARPMRDWVKPSS